MRFTLIKDLSKHTQMRALLLGMLLFISLFILSDIGMKASLIGLTNQQVITTIYGDEEEFIEPITQGTLLEMIHADIFFMMMTLSLLSSIYTRLVGGSKMTNRLISLLFLSALGSLGFLLLAFYSEHFFTTLYLSSFYIWHSLALLFSLISIKKLL